MSETLSEPTLELHPPPDAAGVVPRPGPERVVPVLGALLVVIAVTSLVDDAGIADVAWWIPLLLAALAAGAALTVLTIARLLRSGIEVDQERR